jgi:hypothetical protein
MIKDSWNAGPAGSESPCHHGPEPGRLLKRSAQQAQLYLGRYRALLPVFPPEIENPALYGRAISGPEHLCVVVEQMELECALPPGCWLCGRLLLHC